MIKDKVNFVSIPRTGTNSIYQVLNGGVDRATNHKSIRITKDNRFSFAVMREPLNRLMSWWKYHSHAGYDPTGKIYGVDFNDWVDRGCPHHWSSELCINSGISSPLRQWEFICDHNYKNILVDKVLNFDNLNIEFAQMIQPFNSNMRLNHLNRSNPKPISISSKNKQLIKQQFKKDFEIYEQLFAK